MSKQIDIFEKSKKDWNEEFSKSKSRDKSFDTLSGVSQKPLYYPSEPDNDFMKKLSFLVLLISLVSIYIFSAMHSLYQVHKSIYYDNKQLSRDYVEWEEVRTNIKNYLKNHFYFF